MHHPNLESGFHPTYERSPWERGPVLILVPHPDDEVVGCSAAVRRARAAGLTVFAAFLTTGVPERDRLWPWQRRLHGERVARRLLEKATVLKEMGLLEAAQQDWPSRSLKEALLPLYHLVSEWIVSYGIQCLWAPAYEGGHQDHDAVNFIASRFQDRCTVWEFAEYNWNARKIGINQFPQLSGQEWVLPLEPVEQAEKQHLLALYASERGNLRYAGQKQECFRRLFPYDYSRPPHEGTLFYQRFQWVPFHHPRIDFSRPEELCDRIAKFCQAEQRYSLQD